MQNPNLTKVHVDIHRPEDILRMHNRSYQIILPVRGATTCKNSMYFCKLVYQNFSYQLRFKTAEFAVSTLYLKRYRAIESPNHAHKHFLLLLLFSKLFSLQLL